MILQITKFTLRSDVVINMLPFLFLKYSTTPYILLGKAVFLPLCLVHFFLHLKSNIAIDLILKMETNIGLE